jgi:hypothetical protein
MPRAHRTVLLRLTVETAKRTRKCDHSKAHSAGPGEQLLVVREPGLAAGSHPYCSTCAIAMLNEAQLRLDALRRELLGDPDVAASDEEN